MIPKASIIYQNKWLYIEIEPSEIPWLKIFSKNKEKEFSHCHTETQKEIFQLLLLIETEMLDYFKPDKINIASFANYLPQVHWHIMARFKTDSYFPEPVWGKKQRQASLNYPSFEQFILQLKPKLEVF